MIEFRQVTQRFGQTTVLDSLSFTIPEGTSAALLGLSGSGKTTALKLICGLYLPDEGSVRVNGQELGTTDLLSLRRKLGYVIQDGGLFPHLTGLANITIVGQEAGWAPARIQTRVEELAALTRIPVTLLQRYPREMSGGQRQRVGIVRALFLDPPILLLDEPLGSLDPITRSQLQHELKGLFRELKKTVLLVTHDLHEANYLAQRILLLDQGKIAQAGTFAELTQTPATDFVKLFVGAQQFQPAEAFS